MKRLGTVLFLVLLVFFNSVQANAEAISETIENQQNTIISTFVEHGVNETVAINLAARVCQENCVSFLDKPLEKEA